MYIRCYIDCLVIFPCSENYVIWIDRLAFSSRNIFFFHILFVIIGILLSRFCLIVPVAPISSLLISFSKGKDVKRLSMKTSLPLVMPDFLIKSNTTFGPWPKPLFSILVCAPQYQWLECHVSTRGCTQTPYFISIANWLSINKLLHTVTTKIWDHNFIDRIGRLISEEFSSFVQIFKQWSYL